MRERLMRFMAGRNGNDRLNIFLLALELLLLLMSAIFSGGFGRYVSPFALLLLIYIYYRMLSRNIYKRKAENAWYMKRRNRVLSSFRLVRERWVQRRDFRFFSCPSCRTTLRVPKGKGQIKIVCRKCGTSFVRKT